MGVNSLPKTVTRQRRDCDLNPGPSSPESSTLTTRLPSHPGRWWLIDGRCDWPGCLVDLRPGVITIIPAVIRGQVKAQCALRSVGGVLISLSRPWARSWINHWCLWRMASVTPDLRLPSQPQGITAPWPLPNYTACWQRHKCVNNLPKVEGCWRMLFSRWQKIEVIIIYLFIIKLLNCLQCFDIVGWVAGRASGL